MPQLYGGEFLNRGGGHDSKYNPIIAYIHAAVTSVVKLLMKTYQRIDYCRFPLVSESLLSKMWCCTDTEL